MTLDTILSLLCHKDNGNIPAPLAEQLYQLFKRLIERNGLATHCMEA